MRDQRDDLLVPLFAQNSFLTLSRNAYSEYSPINEERLSVPSKPREFEINKRYAEQGMLSSQLIADLAVCKDQFFVCSPCMQQKAYEKLENVLQCCWLVRYHK